MIKPSQRRVMAQCAVQDKSVSIVLACTVFGISEIYYHYQPVLNDENEDRRLVTASDSLSQAPGLWFVFPLFA